MQYTWRGVRVVEGTGLENQQARKGLVGSNPTPSAIAMIPMLKRFGPIFGFAALGGLIFYVCAASIDPDFGWHLQAGRYILAHGIPTHDIFTYTAADFRWIDHEWLSDVVMALLFGAGGYWLLAAVWAVIWLAAIGLASNWKWDGGGR